MGRTAGLAPPGSEAETARICSRSRALHARPSAPTPAVPLPRPRPPFDSIYRHGFARVAVATPSVEVASPALNAAATIELARQAARDQSGARAVSGAGPVGVFERGPVPAGRAARRSARRRSPASSTASRDLPLVLVVGVPLRVDDRLFNCGVVVHRGRLLGVGAEDLPAELSRVLREAAVRLGPAGRSRRRSGCSGRTCHSARSCCSPRRTCRASCCNVEICEDVWVPLPPSTFAALAGATVIANLSASDVTVGKADYRRLLCASQSAKCVDGVSLFGRGPGRVDDGSSPGTATR